MRCVFYYLTLKTIRDTLLAFCINQVDIFQTHQKGLVFVKMHNLFKDLTFLLKNLSVFFFIIPPKFWITIE